LVEADGAVVDSVAVVGVLVADSAAAARAGAAREAVGKRKPFSLCAKQLVRPVVHLL